MVGGLERSKNARRWYASRKTGKTAYSCLLIETYMDQHALQLPNGATLQTAPKQSSPTAYSGSETFERTRRGYL